MRVIIFGNMPDMLTNVSLCADNLCFYGPFGAPTMLVSGMIIAGEETGAEGHELGAAEGHDA